MEQTQVMVYFSMFADEFPLEMRYKAFGYRANRQF